MDNSKSLPRMRSTTGDAAVDGLINGVIAGVVMAIYLIVAGLMLGVGIAATLSAFDLEQGTSPMRGVLIHLAVAAIYGMLFGLLLRPIERRWPIGRGGHVISGLVYGLLLWSITQIAFAAGISVALSSVPTVHLAIAHTLYGLTLGWLIGR